MNQIEPVSSVSDSIPQGFPSELNAHVKDVILNQPVSEWEAIDSALIYRCLEEMAESFKNRESLKPSIIQFLCQDNQVVSPELLARIQSIIVKAGLIDVNCYLPPFVIQPIPILHAFVLAGKKEVVQFLAEKNPELLLQKTATGMTALDIAIDAGQFALVQWLADKAPSLLGERGIEECSVLERAVSKKRNPEARLEFVRFLVEKVPTHLFEKDGEKRRVIEQAIAYGTLDVIRYLVDKAPELLWEKHLECKFLERPTLLTFAIIKDRLDVIQYLVGKEPFLLFAKDSNGKTILHIAIEAMKENHDMLSVIQYLVDKAPALLFEKDQRGKIPLQMGFQIGKREVEEFLEKFVIHLINNHCEIASVCCSKIIKGEFSFSDKECVEALIKDHFRFLSALEDVPVMKSKTQETMGKATSSLFSILSIGRKLVI